MIRHISSKNLARANHGWLDSHFHFSFADYFNPDNINFGVLRVINDDLVKPGTGFETHPHRDMEILSYVIDGELSHADSMRNRQTLSRGQVQYMSAGTGVLHSEHNWNDETLRFLQIWILPDRKNHQPNYGDYRFAFEDRVNNWLPVASGVDNKDSEAPIRIHSDVNAYALVLEDGHTESFSVNQGRQAYLVCVEGEADINGITVSARDGMEITEETITITPKGGAHFFLIEMEKE